MLTDSRQRPLRDLRISVTDRCNFRCGYCMPKDVFGKNHKFLKSDSLLSYEEIERLVQIFSSLGVEKIRLTGGEPLLRKNLEALIEKISATEGIRDVALTSNASLLTKERAESLKGAGLKRINISLDALTPEIYQRINQIPYPLHGILKGVDNALNTGFDTVKINMVVQKGINVSDILPMVEYFKGSGAILRFIEYMDVGNHNRWKKRDVFSATEILTLINNKYPVAPLDPNSKSEVARRWKFKDGSGEIGVIASITQPFCGNCVRARLSAAGELFTCLFAASGHNLKALLINGNSDSQIQAHIHNIWRNRDDQYSVLRNKFIAAGIKHSQKVEMSYIGG